MIDAKNKNEGKPRLLKLKYGATYLFLEYGMNLIRVDSGRNVVETGRKLVPAH